MNDNLGDNYETHPFDLNYMLTRWVDREHDVVWDPFVASGSSQREMEKRGYRVYGGTENVMELERAPPSVTIIVTNPPFSDKSAILRKLASFNVRFVLLLPTIVIQRDYFSAVVRSSFRHWHVALPNKSLAFHGNGRVQHLPAFKSCFIASSPALGSPACALMNRVENVEFSLLSYDEIRKRGGYVSSEIETE